MEDGVLFGRSQFTDSLFSGSKIAMQKIFFSLVILGGVIDAPVSIV